MSAPWFSTREHGDPEGWSVVELIDGKPIQPGPYLVGYGDERDDILDAPDWGVC